MGDELLEAYEYIEINGKDLWNGLVTDFRSHTIESWRLASLKKRTTLLIKMGVYIKK